MMEHPLGQFREEMDRLFDRFFARWPSPFEGAWPTPAEWGRDPERLWGLDLEDTGNEILVRAEAPGFEPKDFDVHLSGNTLTIRAEHKHEAEEKQEGYRYSERRYGRFQQSVPLPAAVEADKVEAHYRNGVLELRLPRTEPIQRKRIEVKT
jgi:HSP20 family protein